jgi:hypothetical protein
METTKSKYRLVSHEEQKSPTYVAGPKDVWVSDGLNPFYFFRNTAFHIVPNPSGGFISEFFDDYSDDPRLAPFNDVSFESATTDEAIAHWVEVISRCYADSKVVRLIFSEDEKYPLCLADYETLVAVAAKTNTTVEALVADAVCRAICGGLADCLGDEADAAGA